MVEISPAKETLKLRVALAVFLLILSLACVFLVWKAPWGGILAPVSVPSPLTPADEGPALRRPDEGPAQTTISGAANPTATRTLAAVKTATLNLTVPLPPTVMVSPIPAVTTYGDRLADGWQDWSWGTTRSLSNSNPVQSGSASAAITFTSGWGGFNLHNENGLSTAGLDQIVFWIHGGPGGNQKVNLVANKDITRVFSVTASANRWEKISVPLSRLGDPTVLKDVTWQDGTGSAQPVFYLDAIEVSASGRPTATPTVTPTPGSFTLRIDAAANPHPISPDIYGMNFADESLAKELRLPVDRYGGNATTRYNWQNDTSNRASDWFFENIPNQNSNPTALPDGSASDAFVDQDRRTGTSTLLTIPMIGWTPKNRAVSCGFAVSSYGAQQKTDPYRLDCGNGVRADGTTMTGNNPSDTSIAIGPIFVQDWVRHLVGRYGTADHGGVRYYNLDNEPMLWNQTHRDVHPAPTSYDEIRNLTYQYADAIKAVDPSARTLGPVLWGWTAYFYSALDSSAGNQWWNLPQDRLAHGNTPFIEWYLQQMRAYEQSRGQRILDYLDLHYYPQSGVALTSAGDALLQAKRLRSTRSLWDPQYVDESWIREPVRLIPRMRDWVNHNYPGTRLSLTEYNFGGLEDINGALTQADVLGIFGREGLDLATLWDPPEPGWPGAYAFRIYRNYDGAGGAFGETSLQATSPDQEKLAIYAASRANDGALTLLVINKTTGTQNGALALANFSAGSTASVYRYSAADLGRIIRQADQSVSVGGFATSFPASSITLIVIPRQ